MDYIVVSEYEDSDCIELPLEDDDTVLLTTVNGIFPKVCGLKYRSPNSDSFRALRLTDGKFYKPTEGWDNRIFICVFSKDNNKRKNDEESEKPNNKAKRVESRKCTDLIVLNLGWSVDEEILKKYFSKYGELVLAQVKRERESQQSRGYAFIRYLNYESQVLCLADKHLIDGRWCPVKVPFSKNEADKQEISKKIHISYPSEDITTEDIRNTFEEYGYVTEIFVPKPFRNFAFVTFDSSEVVQSLIGLTLEIKGHNVTVGGAVPKINNIKKNIPMDSPMMTAFPGMYNEYAMQNQVMTPRYGMVGGFGGGWIDYGAPKQRGHYDGYNMQYMLGNGQKNGHESIQQGYANQDNMMHHQQQSFFGGQYQQSYEQQQMASSTINILNNPEVVAAIVAAATKGFVPNGRGKYNSGKLL